VHWRAAGSASAVAAGRVDTQTATFDLRAGEQRGTHPPFTTLIGLL
jgi:hypothetical protein